MTSPAVAELRRVAQRRTEVDLAELTAIETARAAGITWRAIAAALELNSPQSAQYHRAALALRYRTPQPGG